jgi:hypothetical protein
VKLTCLGLALIVAVCGCAAAPYWRKPGVSPPDVAQDDGDCRRQSSEATPRAVGRGGGRTGPVWVNQTRYQDCMRAKGYEWRTSGEAHCEVPHPMDQASLAQGAREGLLGARLARRR